MSKIFTYLNFYRRSILICIIFFLINTSNAQSQLNFLSRLPIDTTVLYNPTTAADTICLSVWGYVAPTGTEYALVGTSRKIYFVDVSNPTSPHVSASRNLPGLLASDINVYGHYAYMVASGSTGLQLKIYDLQNLPSSVTESTMSFSSSGISYSLYIDKIYGYLYIFGPVANGLGAKIYNLNPNPASPVIVGHYTTSSLHDGHVIDNTILIGMNIQSGVMEYIDVSNKATPTLLGNVPTPLGVGYSPWKSNLYSNIVYGTDETGGSSLTAYDISDPTDIQIIDKTRRNNTAMMYNIRLNDEYASLAYSNLGASLFDCHVPQILTEVANFRWNSIASNPYCADIYSLLPSHNILAIDPNHGLLVLQPVFQRASYLVGYVKDTCGNAITSANIKLLEQLADSAMTNTTGQFKNGYAYAGWGHIVLSASGYTTDTITHLFVPGVIDTITFYLQKDNPPPIYISPNDTVCFGSTVSLSTDPIPSGYTWQWYKDGVPISGATTNSYTATMTGIYQLQKISSTGCFVLSKEQNLNILDAMDLTISGNSTLVCGSIVYTYEVDEVSSYQYTWTVTGGSIISGQGTHSIQVLWNNSYSAGDVSVNIHYP